MNLKLIKKTHRFLALTFFIPLLITSVTGSLLLLRSSFNWIQPQKIVAQKDPSKSVISVEDILNNHTGIKQIIFYPTNNVFAIRKTNREEIQINAQTGEVLDQRYRLSGLLLDIHEGKLFKLNYVLFLPSAIAMIILIISGLIIVRKTKPKAN